MNEIEVGAADDDGTIDYWIAKESVRQGELLLSNQVGLRTIYNSNAVSVLGWSVTISVALAGWIVVKISTMISSGFRAEDRSLIVTAMATFLSMFAAAVFCIWSLLPRRGTRLNLSGIPPRALLETSLRTELEVLRSIAEGYRDATEKNRQFLERFRTYLRIAWICFVLSPVFGLLAYTVFGPLGTQFVQFIGSRFLCVN